MWTPVLIGTGFSLAAIPIWLVLYETMGVEGFALASTLVMVGYALGMLVAWGFDSGWAAVRRLAPAFARGMFSAAVAGGLGLLVVNRLLPDGVIEVWSALWIGLAGGLTTLAAFFAVSALLRAPEMREVLRR